MKQALIGLSFDDGREDTYRLGYPILTKYQLPATFNITTGFVKGVIHDFVNEEVKPMSVEMLKDLYLDPHMEIAGHGFLHINSLEDILTGIQSLCELLETKSLYNGFNGYASPYSGITPSQIKKIYNKLCVNNISYVRLSLRYHSYKWIKILARKLSRVVKLPWLYYLSYKDTLMHETEYGVLYSIPVLSSVSIEQLKAIVREAVRERAVCLLMFHSIVKKGNVRDNWDYEDEKFELLCAYLKDCQQKGFLKVDTTMDIFNELKK